LGCKETIGIYNFVLFSLSAMFLHHQTQIFHHMKQQAQEALNGNRLQQAVEFYTEALRLAQTFPHLLQEMPKILSNRSLVFFKQRDLTKALDDANASIQLDPSWVKVKIGVSCLCKEKE
jgi:tetratricopeptide (TPR) repeat protein